MLSSVLIVLVLSFLKIEQTVEGSSSEKQCIANGKILTVSAEINDASFKTYNRIVGTCNVSTYYPHEEYRLQWFIGDQQLEDCPHTQMSDNVCFVNTTLPMKILSPITCRMITRQDVCDFHVTLTSQQHCSDGSKVWTHMVGGNVVNMGQRMSGNCIVRPSSDGIIISPMEWILNNETVITCYHEEVKPVYECKIEKYLPMKVTGHLVCQVTTNQYKLQTVCNTLAVHVFNSHHVNKRNVDATAGNFSATKPRKTSTTILEPRISESALQNKVTPKYSEPDNKHNPEKTVTGNTLVTVLAACVILLLLTCVCGGIFMYWKMRKLRRALLEVSSVELIQRPTSVVPPRPPKNHIITDSLDPPDGYEPMGPGIVPIYDQLKQGLEDKEVDYDEVYTHVDPDPYVNSDYAQIL